MAAALELGKKRIGQLGIMARPLRLEYEGAFYHVTARGNDSYPYFEETYGHDLRPDRPDVQRADIFCCGKGVIQDFKGNSRKQGAEEEGEKNYFRFVLIQGLTLHLSLLI